MVNILTALSWKSKFDQRIIESDWESNYWIFESEIHRKNLLRYCLKGASEENFIGYLCAAYIKSNQDNPKLVIDRTFVGFAAMFLGNTGKKTTPEDEIIPDNHVIYEVNIHRSSKAVKKLLKYYKAYYEGTPRQRAIRRFNRENLLNAVDEVGDACIRNLNDTIPRFNEIYTKKKYFGEKKSDYSDQSISKSRHYRKLNRDIFFGLFPANLILCA